MHFGVFMRKKFKILKIQDFGNVITFVHEGYFHAFEHLVMKED